MKKYLAIFAAFLIGIYAGLPQAALAGNGGGPEESPPDVTPSEAGKAEIERLRIPHSWVIVIDPFEIDGKGQIYSGKYTIENAGEEKGTLILHSLACTPEKGSGVVVKQSKQGIHEGEKKKLYLEMVFDNGDRVVFSPEGMEYRAELEPGETLSFSFSGELNENAVGSWKDGDVGVSAEYSWEPEEVAAESRENRQEKPEEDKDQDVSPTAPEAENGETQEEETIRLRKSREWVLMVDGWTTDQEGRMAVSRMYILENDSDTKGVLRIGAPQGDAAEVSHTDAPSGEAEEMRRPVLIVDGEEQPEQAGGTPLYEAELAPGEKVSVCFGQGLEEDDFAGQEINRIRAGAECSWEN